MSDASIILRPGERFPVTATAKADTETVTLGPLSSNTVRMVDTITGAEVFAARQVTGITPAAAADVEAWYDLDSSAPAPGSAALADGGRYRMDFVLAGIADDGMPRRYEVSVGVRVVGAPDYSDIFDQVRDALVKTEDDLPDTNGRLIRQTEYIATALLSAAGCPIPSIGTVVSASCLGATYADLTGADKDLFDQAAGLLVAARLRPGDLAAVNDGSGPERRKRVGPNETEWAGSASVKTASGDSLEASWEKEAYRLLLSISCIQAAAAARAAGYPSPYALAGYSRDQENRGLRRLWWPGGW